MHVNVPFTRLEVAGEREGVKTPTLTSKHQTHRTPTHHHPTQTSSHNQTSRPQSLKKPLAILDSRKVTVRELRVTSVTVTSPGPTTGLQTSLSGFSDAVTSSVPIAELHSSVLSCPGGDRNVERGRWREKKGGVALHLG